MATIPSDALSPESSVNSLIQSSTGPVSIESDIASPTANTSPASLFEDKQTPQKDVPEPPQNCWQACPVEIQDKIIEYTLADWHSIDSKVAACVRGLRGNASKIFYDTCVFDLRDKGIAGLAKIPLHVFAQIQHVAVNTGSCFSEYLVQVILLVRLELISVQFFQGTWYKDKGEISYAPNSSIYTEIGALLDTAKVQRLSVTFQRPRILPEDALYYSEDYCVRTINSALGGVQGYLLRVSSGDETTWFWRAPRNDRLRWSRYYPTIN